ncbi:MAG: AI-2E family transporter [Coriobacteriia bacterium]|nr:AI-2E family transporter [Coriobacteriia bacterium]
MAVTTTPRPHDRWLRALVIAWALVGVLVLMTAAGWLLGKVAAALVPFGFAIIIVYLFRGPVAALEERGWKRGLAVGLCYLVGFIVVGGALAFIIPPLVEQIREFVEAFPGYYDRAQALILDVQDRWQALVVPQWVAEALDNLQATIARQSAEWSAILAREVFSVGGRAIELFGNALLALVIGFWMLKDLPTIKQEALLLAGPERREEATVVTHQVSQVLGGYLRGQLILSSATAIIVVIGLTIFGVPYSLVIGLLAGLFNVIPWIGPALSAVIAGIAAAFVNPWLAVAGVGTVIAAQQLTEIFVQPRVMSEQVDLHPLLVIFSLLAGSVLFGFVGLLLAIPVAAVAKGLFVYYFEKYTDSKLTTEEGAFFRSRAGDMSTDECEPCTADRERVDASVRTNSGKDDVPEEDV